jgi:hypothetical protein
VKTLILLCFEHIRFLVLIMGKLILKKKTTTTKYGIIKFVHVDLLHIFEIFLEFAANKQIMI